MASFAFTLCADDYAMTPGVSRGIREAMEAGALTATSVMTNMPGWTDEAGPLRRFEGRADIGLHLNLTLGAPLGAMPTLAPAGTLPTIGALMTGARRGTLPLAEIAEEIERQADRFVTVFGRPPDHVDGHQHVHVLRALRPLVLAVMTRRGWHAWLRDSADRPARILSRGGPLAKAVGVAFLAHGLGGEADRAGIAVNEGFAGFSSFEASIDYGRQFARYLRSPGRHHLVMCHPGYVDAALRRLDPVVEARERELAFLLSPAFGALLASRNARSARFAAAPDTRASSRDP